MKSSNISFYFILYIVAMITVFVITMERDQLLRQRDEDIAHLVEVYVKPMRLSSYVDTTRLFIDPNGTVTREPVSVRMKVDGPLEKNDITFTLVQAWKRSENGELQPASSSARVINENGDGVLISPPLEAGVYEFKVAGYKKRIVSDGKSMRVTIRDTTYAIQYSPRLEKVDRDTTILITKVENSGVTPPQLTLSIQETHDNWVIGPAFRKKVFIGGVEDIGAVTFSVAPTGQIERTKGERSSVALVWNNPSLGKRTFTITANANRGLGDKDRATTTFSVDVYPAAFVSSPQAKGFWGIPYVFDGQIAGLNPLDLSLERSHDGQPLGNRPVVPRDTITPDRTWSSLLFKVMYHGTAIKEHRISIAAPPPPQIRWTQQNLDRARNVFLISATSSDPIGGPVRMSVQSEPQGIAQLDRIKGTSFTVTVNLGGKPSAVFLKLSATDQYGGQSVSAKQFNIPQ